MTKNMAPADRVFRAVAAVLLGFAAFMGLTDGWIAEWFSILLAVIGAYMAVTAATGHCFIYRLVGIDGHTHPEDEVSPYGIHHQ